MIKTGIYFIIDEFNLFICVQAATKLLDEMCHLTAQSLTALDTSEHFKLLKLLGEGSYGKVMLAVHRERGEFYDKFGSHSCREPNENEKI